MRSQTTLIITKAWISHAISIYIRLFTPRKPANAETQLIYQTTFCACTPIKIFILRRLFLRSKFQQPEQLRSNDKPRRSVKNHFGCLAKIWRPNVAAQMGVRWYGFSAAVAETGFDIESRCAFVRRYDPRYCYWQISNGNDKRVTAFGRFTLSPPMKLCSATA